MKLLDISYNFIGDDGFNTIAQCIAKFESLKIGDRDDETLTMKGVEALSAAIQTRSTPVSNGVRLI